MRCSPYVQCTKGVDLQTRVEVVLARKGCKWEDSDLLARAWIFRRGRDFRPYRHTPSGKGEGDFEAEAVGTVEKMEKPRVGDSE